MEKKGAVIGAGVQLIFQGFQGIGQGLVDFAGDDAGPAGGGGAAGGVVQIQFQAMPGARAGVALQGPFKEPAQVARGDRMAELAAVFVQGGLFRFRGRRAALAAHGGIVPQRGWRSRAGVLCPFIGAKRRPLTATAAEATRVSAPGRPFQPRPFDLNTLTPQQPKVTPAATASRTSSP